MKKLATYLSRFSRIWFIAWLIGYVFFLIASLVNPDAWPVIACRYGGLVLAFAFVMRYYGKDYRLLLALGLILVADAFLIADHVSVYGIIVFILVQLAHLSRLFRSRRLILAVWILTCIAFAVVGALESLPPRYLLCGVYFLTLLLNLSLSVRWLLSSRKSIAAISAVVGFALFLACDTCVGFSYFSSIGALPTGIFSVANYLAWLFYYPSQIFLANSSKLNKSMLQ